MRSSVDDERADQLTAFPAHEADVRVVIVIPNSGRPAIRAGTRTAGTITGRRLPGSTATTPTRTARRRRRVLRLFAGTRSEDTAAGITGTPAHAGSPRRRITPRGRAAAGTGSGPALTHPAVSTPLTIERRGGKHSDTL